MGDKYIITDNIMLTDKHIHAVQKLINKDFLDIVQQTPTLSHERFYELTADLRVKKVIQIHKLLFRYINGNEHWVVSTNNEDKAVYHCVKESKQNKWEVLTVDFLQYQI